MVGHPVVEPPPPRVLMVRGVTIHISETNRRTVWMINLKIFPDVCTFTPSYPRILDTSDHFFLALQSLVSTAIH